MKLIKEWIEMTEAPYRKDIKTLFEELNTKEVGLTNSEAKKRLEKYGPNELQVEGGISPLQILIAQFKDILVIILLIATLVSLMLGEVLDASVIFAIVIASVILGFVQEYRAEKALLALQQLAAPKAKVVREGIIEDIPAREVVPGDILYIEEGDKVPADARIFENFSLMVDEAVLTGESVPVTKNTRPIEEKDVPLSDMKNMLFMGTIITYGRGKALVVGTGMNTEFGKIAKMLKSVGIEKTPLQEKLEEVGKWLGILSLIVCGAVALTGIFRGYPPLDMFIWGVSLAVAAVPEALPAVVTISLAVGTQRMAKRNAIVRKLYAVESLGAVTTICTDKTGTLTKNEMTVRELFLPSSRNRRLIKVTGSGYEPVGEFLDESGNKIKELDADTKELLKVGALCNDAIVKRYKDELYVNGDPTEIALIVSAKKAGLEKEALENDYPRVGEILFDSTRKRMSTIHKTYDGRIFVFVKGAPELLLDKCGYYLENGEVKKLTLPVKSQILSEIKEMALRALRVLGMAYKEIHFERDEYLPAEMEHDLIFVGMQGMIDPPRPEIKAAIERAKNAGINVSMVTGDHELTAVAVAKDVGLLSSDAREIEVINGHELDNIGDEKFKEIVDQIKVYARATPEHKLKIVKALKEKGHIVAMTGDGINDAPAVKLADVGISMGIKGTDVTKEASEIVLADDNFASIVAAVEEGRIIYDNIKKYLMYLLSCNIGEILLVFIASLIDLPLPLVAIQILMINLTTDGLPAIALSMDPPDPDIMSRKPRDPNESIFTPRVKFIIGLGGSLMALIGVPLFYYYLTSTNNLIYAQTLVFWFVTVFEMFRAFATRSEKYPIIKLGFTTNRYLLVGIVSSILITLGLIYIAPLQVLFHTVPLSLEDLILSSVLATLSLLVIDLGKIILNKYHMLE